MKMKIAFYTLGCKVNQYETQAMKEQFSRLGWDIVGEEEIADVYVVNSCTVTNQADRKTRQYMRRMKKRNPGCITALVGCYAQVNPKKARSLNEVDIVAGTDEKACLPEYIASYIDQKVPLVRIRAYKDIKAYEEIGAVTGMGSRTRAYIKVQDGCNQFCSYCVIPYARGGIRSRSKENILKEAEILISNGYKELVLTGINTALYGDEYEIGSGNEPYGIESVVASIDQMPGDFRIRLGSLEPTVVSAEYVKRLLKYKRLCPHMHLSLQSGSDKVLQKMNRRYSCREYLDIVRVLRESDPCYGLSTDIIAGFPGETDEDVLKSVKMIRRCEFQKVHVFPYSLRKGTKAAAMEGQHPMHVKKLRCAHLIKESESVSLKVLKKNLGKTRVTLFEEYDNSTGCVSGYSDNYIRVYCDVSCKEAKHLINQFVPVTFEKLFLEGIKGTACITM
jgi:threonylcarbamoyladenosine tRNA methylthiotransferase MtaB